MNGLQYVHVGMFPNVVLAPWPMAVSFVSDIRPSSLDTSNISYEITSRQMLQDVIED